jgi:Putative transposase/Transposase zinc-binding domain
MDIGLADVLRQFAPACQQRHPAALLPSHQRAIRDILACHTPALGGHLRHCAQCDKDVYVYHGCRNRACPACHAAQTQQWLLDRQEELLPCAYFHLTATVPEGLRDVFRSNQKVLYHLLMSLTAQCVMEVAASPRHLGAAPGILAVLHTWTGTLSYHPHVHCLVTGGRVSPDGKDWIATRPGFFLPVRVLSRHLRHLFEQTLQKRHPDLFARAPAAVWRQEWVVHCVPWGRGQHGVLDYLARYVFRIAITDRRILAMDDQSVTFQYKDRKANRRRTCRLEGTEFVRRYLQHVLPRGFHKVRYYGLWNPKRRDQLEQVRLLLQLQRPPDLHPQPPDQPPAPRLPEPFKPFVPLCPCCGGELVHVGEIPRPRCRGP